MEVPDDLFMIGFCCQQTTWYCGKELLSGHVPHIQLLRGFLFPRLLGSFHPSLHCPPPPPIGGGIIVILAKVTVTGGKLHDSMLRI